MWMIYQSPLTDCNKSYITVTCHFIFSNRLHSPVLATREVKDSHTGLNIATALTHMNRLLLMK